MVRARPDAPPILVLPTYDADSDIVRAIEAGATVLVAGTATFAGGSDAYAANIARLRGPETAP